MCTHSMQMDVYVHIYTCNVGAHERACVYTWERVFTRLYLCIYVGVNVCIFRLVIGNMHVLTVVSYSLGMVTVSTSIKHWPSHLGLYGLPLVSSWCSLPVEVRQLSSQGITQTAPRQSVLKFI